MSATTFRKALATIGVLAVIAGGTASAYAGETQWEKTHPRRDQVNDRIQTQHRRIHEEVREGDMSKKKAARLLKRDHQIRKEEQHMAAAHDGHITKGEQNALNRQENAVSRQIGK